MHNPLKTKDRLLISRQLMPEQAPDLRSHNFREVNLGLDPKMAAREALRCLQCKTEPCKNSCPVGVKVKEFIDLILAEDYLGAAAKIREDNVLPAITGRVCPQEDQCEGGCVVGKKGKAVGIGYLERFVADYERKVGKTGLPPKAPATGKKVAIVGSGPASLAAAGDLIQKGHEVSVLEALHEIGGVLIYGIPEFRLPKQIVREEVDNLRKMGVDFQTNVVVGRTVTVDELLTEDGYDAVLVATGAGLPHFLNIPGENLCGVYSANEFLTRVNLMKAGMKESSDQPLFDCIDKDVVVIGAGNTAMDAVRTSLRVGAKSASIVYRRSEAEMPARAEEVHHAHDEGVCFNMLSNPTEFTDNGEGWLKGLICQKMKLGEADESGRRRPEPIADSEFELPASMAIIAVGNSGNPLVQSTTPDLKTTPRGYIVAEDDSLKTSKRGVFAAGDIVTGGATVIIAMGTGRKAAKAIHEFLESDTW